MKTIISVGGRFWAFHQAEQLNKFNALDYIITTSYNRNEEKIPDSKIKAIRSPELLGGLLRRTPFLNRSTLWNTVKDDLFDRFASSVVSKTDIFIGYASYSLKTLQKAKQLGAITVLERGNIHVLDQNELMREEYEKLGVKFIVNKALTNKQLEEYDRSDYISVPCEYIRKSFIDRGYPDNKVFVLSLGVDLEKFNKLPREDDKFRVIYVGGIQARKGILYLLEAFTKLKGLDAELILVGTVYPEMRKTMKKYEGTYKYFPPVEQPKLKKFYSNSSVFVIPSIDDGFAMVTAEAMACGLPIIVTTNTGISDVIEEERHGFVVPIRDSEAIADKIEILYREKSLLEYMSTEAQLKSKGLTWNTYGEKMMEIYKGLLKENKI
jgi:glycosyltransferase involved in cell wall biosynthesis